MAAFRYPRTSQPQGAGSSRIDWSNPITRGLAVLRDGPLGLDGVTRATPVSGSVISGVGPIGLLASYTAGSTGGHKYASGNLTTGPATVFAVCTRRGTNAASLRLYSETNGAAAGLDLASAGSTSDLTLTIGTSATSAQTVALGFFSGYDNTLIRIGVVTDGVIPSPSTKLFRNGLLQTASLINAGSGSQNARSTYSMFGNNAVNPTGSPRGWNGDIYLGLVWNRALSDSEIKSISNNPWQIFAPVSRQIWVPVSGGGLVTATGVASTAAVGTVAPKIDAPLAGASGTAAQGTLIPALTVPAIGVSSTAATGTATPNITVALSGVSTATATGTMTTGGDVTVAATGVSTAAATGTVAPSITVALSGASSAAATGALSATLQQTLSGAASPTALGMLSPQISAPLTGNSSTTALGTMVVPGDLTVALTGVSGTAALGTLTAVAPSAASKSGVNRLWLIDYYTKAFAVKGVEAEKAEQAKALGLKKRKVLKLKARRLEDAKQEKELEARVEALVEKAQQDIARAAAGIRDAKAAQQFVQNLTQFALESQTPIVDFAPIAQRYKPKDDENELLLFAMVL